MHGGSNRFECIQVLQVQKPLGLLHSSGASSFRGEGNGEPGQGTDGSQGTSGREGKERQEERGQLLLRVSAEEQMLNPCRGCSFQGGTGPRCKIHLF